MRRWLRGLAIAAALAAAFAGLAWYTVRGHTTCEVCVAHGGRQACRTASAAGPEEARQHAQATACALVTSGVTQDLACQRTPPVSVRCEGDAGP